MCLTEVAIRTAKSQPKPYKLTDEKGLYLLVKPNGARLWRLKYRVKGIEKLLALGSYPEIPLRLARDRRDEARRLIAQEIDPAAKRKAERSARPDTFAAVADDSCPQEA